VRYVQKRREMMENTARQKVGERDSISHKINDPHPFFFSGQVLQKNFYLRFGTINVAVLKSVM
jgi:hypothetical protein